MNHMDEKVAKKKSKPDKSKDHKHLQMNGEKDLGSSFGLEPNREKKKKHRERKNKHETDEVFSLNETLEENCTGEAAEGQTYANEGDMTIMMNGEKERNKYKRKKGKGGRDNNEIANSNIATGEAAEGQTCSNITIMGNGEKESNKKKSKKRKGGRDDNEIKNSNLSDEKDMQYLDDKQESKKKKRKTGDDSSKEVAASKLGNKSNGIEDNEFKSNEGDPPLAGRQTGDANADPVFTEVEDQDKKKKKKKKKKVHEPASGGDNAVADTDNSSSPTLERTSKRVTFSDQVEVLDDGLVRGKRYTPEEDEKIKEAVFNYIKSHGLGDEGLNMVLHCRSHREVRNCWKEIGAALPLRPWDSVYYRAHILFERDENHKWTTEEYELIRNFQRKHGSDWKVLAEAMGKHRFHVKDTWRRLKVRNRKKGNWSQEEYQNLFNLVNMDLRMRALEEYRKSKHGMLRDNIAWEAISDKLETRSNANCCIKWYNQLTSPMVSEGIWSDTDDYRLLNALFTLDACCMEEVDWDYLLEHRSGDVCRKRWNQMVQHIGEHGNKSFAEQVEILSKRYGPDLVEAREAFDSKPVVR